MKVKLNKFYLGLLFSLSLFIQTVHLFAQLPQQSDYYYVIPYDEVLSVAKNGLQVSPKNQNQDQNQSPVDTYTPCPDQIEKIFLAPNYSLAKVYAKIIVENVRKVVILKVSLDSAKVVKNRKEIYTTQESVDPKKIKVVSVIKKRKRKYYETTFSSNEKSTIMIR